MFGLIGYPLSHSFSKDFFKRKFLNEKIDSEYRNFPIENLNQFPELLALNPYLKGLNVTIPWKEKIIPFLDKLDPVAAEIGAVNTIRISRIQGKIILTGFNTDTFGFTKSIEEFIPDINKISGALILGTGGSSKAVAYSLRKLEIPFQYVSSSSKSYLSYDSLNKDIISQHRLIINTTPLGMFPKVDNSPSIPYEFLTSNHILFDLIYNPNTTLFMKKGLEHGARAINGLKMLEYQALEAWNIWQDSR